MKITVLGAGAIGTAVAYDLCRREAVTSVQVCEFQPGVLRAFRSQHAHPRLRTFEADARDAGALAPIVAGSACIVSCMDGPPPVALARLALESGAHVVDLGSPPPDAATVAALAETAERRSRWVVTGCGLAPGLVGLLVVRAMARLERPTAARVRVGDVPTHPREPFGYRLAHSAEKLVDDYTEPVPVLRDGEVVHRAPLTGLETVEIEGLGPMEAFYAGRGLGALVEALAGRLERLDAKALRYPGHADQMRFLIDLGLADRTALDVRTHLSYRDVLVRRLRQRLGGAYEDAVAVRVEVEGVAGGDTAEAGTLTYHFVDRYDRESGLSAMQRCTGFPAAAAAVLLGGGEVPGGGLGPAEHVLPVEPLLAMLAERGIRVDEAWAPHPRAAAA